MATASPFLEGELWEKLRRLTQRGWLYWDQKVLCSQRCFCFQVSDSLFLDSSDDEELREQLDMHSIIVSCVNEEPLFTADQVEVLHTGAGPAESRARVPAVPGLDGACWNLLIFPVFSGCINLTGNPPIEQKRACVACSMWACASREDFHVGIVETYSALLREDYC